MKSNKDLCIGMGVALLTTVILLTGCRFGAKGTVIEDSERRYSYRVSADLEPVPTDGTHDHWRYDDPDLEVYIAAADAAVEGDALHRAFARAGIDTAELEVDGVAGFGHWRLVRYAPRDGRWHAVAYQYRGNTAYAFIVKGGMDSDPDSLPAPVFGILTTFEFTEDAGEVFVPSTFADLEAHLDSILEETGGSVSIAAMKDGELVYEYAGGFAAPDTPADSSVAYHWGSITKPVTAVAVMQLVEQGLVDLDATVDRYLPEFEAGRAITVRRLLGHSSGLADRPNTHLIGIGNHEAPTLDEVWDDYRSSIEAPEYEPGSSVVYSNPNFLVLGLMVERLTGEDLTSYIRTKVFDPIGMGSTAHTSAALPPSVREAVPVVTLGDLDRFLDDIAAVGFDREDAVARVEGEIAYLNPVDILPCWGGVKGTPSDAVRFGQLFLDRGAAPGGRVLERASVREMVKPQKSNDGKAQLFGIGWKIDAARRPGYFEHSGGGPGIDSQLRVYPKQNVVIAVFGNVVGYGSGRILEYTYELVK